MKEEIKITSKSIWPLIKSNIGTAPNMHNGDPARTWAIKDNLVIDQVNINTPITTPLQSPLKNGSGKILKNASGKYLIVQ